MKPKIVPLDPEREAMFAVFLKELREHGDEAFFSPHPFTDEWAKKLAHYEGKDYYCVAVVDKRVVGYGMLRGWDEGYSRPSLGIAVHPDERGKGLSKQLMSHLHEVARKRGAKQMRLRVKVDNLVAVGLYRKLGYELKPEQPTFLEGLLNL